MAAAAGIAGEEEQEAVVAGVLEEVRQSFIDSGVGLEVLGRLEELWLSKLESARQEESCHDPGPGPGPVCRRAERKKLKKKKKKKAEISVQIPEEGCAEVEDGIATDEAVVSLLEPELCKPAKKRRVKRLRMEGKTAVLQQLDGPADSSDEEEGVEDEDDGDDDDDDDDDDVDPDGEEEEDGVEEEPLGSEDDISDEDASDLFETDNVVVCQYDKITRARNKWKFHLKDGIMNLNGKDYVFQRATGDAEW